MKLSIQNLSKSYGTKVQALDGINISIGQGMFGLLGPNGAGKTTLMRTIATLQKPDQGAIDLDGLDVLKNKDGVRRTLGYLPQEFGLYPDVTAEYMLGHIAQLKGIADRKQRRDTVNYLLEQTNLSEVRGRKLGGFSGGMKQRFGIAQALVGDPSLLIVDEPTAGLDPEERNRFYNILSEISENRIVILSTHIVDDVSVLCNQFAILDRGKVLLFGSVEDEVAKLNGQVWRKIVPKDQLSDIEERHEVILTRLLGGQVLVHVTSPENPAGFEPVIPDLFDVYFDSIRANRRANNNHQETVGSTSEGTGSGPLNTEN